MHIHGRFRAHPSPTVRCVIIDTFFKRFTLQRGKYKGFRITLKELAGARLKGSSCIDTFKLNILVEIGLDGSFIECGKLLVE